MMMRIVFALCSRLCTGPEKRSKKTSSLNIGHKEHHSDLRKVQRSNLKEIFVMILIGTQALLCLSD